jgi:hypothetical protein
MGDQKTLLVSFEGLSTRAANTAIDNLLAAIKDNAVASGVAAQIQRCERLKESKETQDFGATLIIVLGTPAAVAIAKGVHDYIAKSGNRVVIRTPGGVVKASGDATKNIDIAATVRSLEQ